jgi:hypothetical protein
VNIRNLVRLFKTCDSMNVWFYEKTESEARKIVSSFGEPEYNEADGHRWYKTEKGKLSISAFIKSPESGDPTEEKEK